VSVVAVNLSPHPIVENLAEELRGKSNALQDTIRQLAGETPAAATARDDEGGRTASDWADENNDDNNADSGGGAADPQVLADALARTPDLPDLVTFSGFLGGVVDDSSGEFWQLLYLDAKLLTWLLVQKDGIVYRDRIKDERAFGGQRDVLWVQADTAVGRGSRPQSAQTRFLRGAFTAAGDFAASLPVGTSAPATGIFCDAQTPGCCGRYTR
jgi:hypothetical protein